jgi:ATP-dependent Zn protease
MSKARDVSRLQENLIAKLRADSLHELADAIEAWPAGRAERIFHGTAVHECGHALAAVRLGIHFDVVAIDATPKGENVMMGYVDIPHLGPDFFAGKGERSVIPYLVYLFAGPVAEGCVYGKEAMERGYQLDLEHAEEFTFAAMCDAPPIAQATVDRITKVLHACDMLADTLVKESLNEILLLADALLEQHSLSNDAVKAIIGDRLWQPPSVAQST